MEELSGPKGPGLQGELGGRLSVLTSGGLVLSFLSPEEGFRLSFLPGSPLESRGLRAPATLSVTAAPPQGDVSLPQGAT